MILNELVSMGLTPTTADKDPAEAGQIGLDLLTKHLNTFVPGFLD